MDEKRKAIVLSYVLVVVEAIGGIVFTAILLKHLGQSEYGLYKLAISWMSMVSILDFGLGGTITRYVVKYKTEADKRGERNFLAMAFVVYGVLSALVLIIGLLLCFILPAFIADIDVRQVEEFRTIFFVLTLKTCITLFNHAFLGRFIAYERFVFTKTVSILYTVLRVFLAWCLLPLFSSAIIVVCVDLLLTLAQLLISVAVSKAFHFEPVRLYSWDRVLFKEVLLFTSSIFLASVINQFNSNIDNIVLGAFSTTAIVGLYASVLQIYTVYSMLSTAIQEVFLPQVSRVVFQKKSDDEITMSIVSPSRMQVVVLFLALTGYVLFGYEFLTIWIGNAYDAELLNCAYEVGCLLMVCATWQLFQNSATNILKAKNLLRGKVIITGASAVLNFLITVCLAPKYGMLGAAFGTAVSMIVGYGVATNIYYYRVVKINLKLYYSKTFEKLWYAVPLAFLAGIIIKYFAPQNITAIFIAMLLYTLIYIIVVIGLGLNSTEKGYIKNRIGCR